GATIGGGRGFSDPLIDRIKTSDRPEQHAPRIGSRIAVFVADFLKCQVVANSSLDDLAVCGTNLLQGFVHAMSGFAARGFAAGSWRFSRRRQGCENLIVPELPFQSLVVSPFQTI